MYWKSARKLYNYCVTRAHARVRKSTVVYLLLDFHHSHLSPSSAWKWGEFFANLHQIIVVKLALGLDSQRIFQAPVAEHGFQDKYWSVVRYVRALGEMRW